MPISNLQKAIQIADDLDDQASRLNTYISDPGQKKKDRDVAAEKQNALRQHAAKLRIDAIEQIVGDQAPTIDQIISAADKAKSAANKINEIKIALDLAAATITFFAAVSTGKVGDIVQTFSAFQKAIKASG
jgi:hypothetical protein